MDRDIKHMSENLNIYEWVPTSLRMPTPDEILDGNWKFLCCVLIPERGGFARKDYQVLSYDILDKRWCCDDMIVTHWAVLPKLPDTNI